MHVRAWMFGSVLKRGEVMWLILISFQLSAASASSSLRLSFAVSVSLSTPVTATPRRQMNHEDADRIFSGHFFFFFISLPHTRALLHSLSLAFKNKHTITTSISGGYYNESQLTLTFLCIPLDQIS